ncbi:MAG: type I restriction enzyme HsdR N-terminal domain-containing protein [Bacteroidota bacterium]|nr:MAG: type I restriction enzyme HsdR N-terminal domain-containing protein [Bacteroidota bacterium]
MQALNLPLYSFNIQNKGSKKEIFDEIRRCFVVLTPEEWVRQNILKYLVTEKGFPNGLISIEAGLRVNRLKRRYDGLIYSRQNLPLVLLECKAPAVSINQAVFDQIFAYNTSVSAPYLLITNGMNHFFLKRNAEGKMEFMNTIPEYRELQ